MKLVSMACTHQGRRNNNEDSHLALPDLGLFVVADGMGGYEGGEVASQITTEVIGGFFRRNAQDREATWPFAMDRTLSVTENMVSVSVRLAHQGICARKQGRLAQMGSTIAALVLDRGLAVMGHVGDSRIYRLRAGTLEQLTQDHSLIAEMQQAGMAEQLERASCGFGNVITRALGMPSAAQPDLRTEPVLPDDLYLLCTDGLIERMEDSIILDLLDGLPPADACPRLVEEAYQRGGRDNITAVVVRVE
jgi:serine/threonine protein phosphatase PrpC